MASLKTPPNTAPELKKKENIKKLPDEKIHEIKKLTEHEQRDIE